MESQWSNAGLGNQAIGLSGPDLWFHQAGPVSQWAYGRLIFPSPPCVVSVRQGLHSVSRFGWIVIDQSRDDRPCVP